jgi:hypothetical protein
MSAEISIPLSIAKRFAKWIVNLARMPGRVEQIVSGMSSSQSRAKDCPNCNLKMEVKATYPKDGFDKWEYHCGPCKKFFWYTYGVK